MLIKVNHAMFMNINYIFIYTVKVKLRLFLYFFIKLESFKNSLKASRSNLTFVLNFIDRANTNSTFNKALWLFIFLILSFKLRIRWI